MFKESFLVDYSVFKKSREEKAHANLVKKEWRRVMKMFYGDSWKKYHNYPESLPEA